MTNKPRNNAPRPLYTMFISDCALRISKQEQLIADLRARGESSLHAEVDLKKQEALLRQLKNHAVVMEKLLQPDR